MKNIYIVRRENGTREFLITNSNDQHFVVTVDEHNRIIGYENHNITYIPSDFLGENYWLEKFSAHGVKEIGSGVLADNNFLEVFDCPNVEFIGEHFLQINRSIKTISAHRLKSFGDDCLMHASLTELDTPELKNVGRSFLCDGEIETVSLPKLRRAGDWFMGRCEEITHFDAPMLETLGKNSLTECACVTLNLPNLKSAGYGLLRNNEVLEELKIPRAKITHLDGCLYYNKTLKKLVSLPISVKERNKAGVPSTFLELHPNRQAIIDTLVDPQTLAEWENGCRIIGSE